MTALMEYPATTPPVQLNSDLFYKTRRQNAEQAFVDYDFIQEVEAVSGWESIEPGCYMQRNVFLSSCDGNSQDSEKVMFRVVFESDTSTEIIDSYLV